MDCPRCGTRMQGGVCPECGFPINRARKKKIGLSAFGRVK